MKFKIGDVVILKSGGPAVTVYAVKGPIVSVCWFDSRMRSQIGDFSEAVLDIFTEDDHDE